MVVYLLRWGLRIATALAVVVIVFFVWVVATPFPLDALAPDDLGSSVIVDRHGRVLREVLAPDGTRGRWVALDQIAPALIDATIEAEDQRFREHAGVDGIAVLRSLWIDTRAGEARTGASTITQQVVKLTLMPDAPRTLATKAMEAVWAWRLELAASKDRILEQYLNRIPYGNQLMGAEAAAWMYFGKPARLVSYSEAAFLAVLPQSPARLNPYKRFDEVVARQRRLLTRMADDGVIDQATLARALAEPLQLLPRRSPSEAEHLTARLAAGLEKLAASERPRVLETTLDLDLQERLEGLLRTQAPAAARLGDFQAAVVVIDTPTGAVRAWLGSRDHDDVAALGENDAVVARRQPGSALKPFIYADFIEGGGDPNTMIDDHPRRYETTTGTYAPENYDRKWHGLVSMRTALGSSLNVPAVDTLAGLGVPNLLLLLRSLGLTTLDQRADYYGLGLALGNGEVRLVDLAGAYATLGRLGEYLPVRWLAAAPSVAPKRVLSPETSFIILDWLADDRARQIGFGLAGPLALPFRLAGKTGTSSDYRDNWAFGVTPAYTIGVWVGNFDGTPMERVPGRVGAAPLLRQVAQILFPGAARPGDVAWYDPPPSLVSKVVCAATGRAPDPSCTTTTREWAHRGLRAAGP